MARTVDKTKHRKKEKNRAKVTQSPVIKKGAFFPLRFSTPLLLIILIGVLVYSNTFHVPFIFDDEGNIYKNTLIKDAGYFAKAPVSEILVSPRLIGQLTFVMNHAVYGFDVVGYHIVNLVIHISCALLVYWFVVLIFRTPYFAGCFQGSVGPSFHVQDFAALFVSLLFVSHPIQTQAVTYIVQRYASLATLFYLLALVLYIKYRLSGSSKIRYALYAISIISAMLGMKTKEIAFTLPVMITLCEFMFFRGAMKKRVCCLIPLILTMAIIPLSLIGTQGTSPRGAIVMDQLTQGASLNIITPLDYLNTQFRVIVTYIRLLFLPVNQNLDYDYPISLTFFTPSVFLSFLFLLAIFGFGVYLLWRSYRDEGVNSCFLRLVAFGIFWFFITLSVESSIIPIADVIVEHRLYLPSVGFFMAVMAAALWGMSLFRNNPLAKKVALVSLILVVFSFSITAYARNSVWKDEISIWEDVLKKSPNSYRANFNAGFYHAMQGRYDEAIREFQAAVRINPNYSEAYNNLGLSYLHKGNLDMALREISAALKIEPNLANLHDSLGQVLMAQGRYDKAFDAFQKALKLDPGFAEARKNLEKLHKLMGS